MGDTSDTADQSNQIASALRDLLPQLRRKARNALGAIGLTVLATAAAITLFLSRASGDGDGWEMATYAGFAGVLVVVIAYRWTLSAQEELVMPVLARSIGLDYAKSAGTFVAGLPRRLLPDGANRTGEDLVTARLGAHSIEIAEVKAETGGKNSRTLFRGVVARFPNRTAMPAFFLASEKATRPGLFFGGDLSTEGLHHLRDVTDSSGTVYGVWTSWTGDGEPPALAAVVAALTGIAARTGPDFGLYAATSNGEETHIALTHDRDLFRVGGLFPSEARLFDAVQTAMRDLSVPLVIARALMEAEATAAAKH